jgi:Reverse transcriptase (RNA-dependent DNA polymerase)
MDTGIDGNPLKFIKLILPLILPCITHINNTNILTTSMFPKSWKISKLILIPILTRRLPSYQHPSLPDKGLRNPYERPNPSLGFLNRLQSGFRSAHSTTTALPNVTDGFHKGCERCLITVLLLLDFSKAFDSVIHDLLWKKLSTIFKFDSTTTSLIKSYLSGRSQCVSIGNELSSLAPISKEGRPILFSLFINDLIDAIIFSQCHMYVDDFQLYIGSERSDLSRTIERLNADISVWNWSVQNGLCLNSGKSQAIVVSKCPLQDQISHLLC